MSIERDLYWTIRAAQTQGISVEKFFEEARITWRDVRAELTRMENQALAKVRP